jgi:hypothetical protein
VAGEAGIFDFCWRGGAWRRRAGASSAAHARPAEAVGNIRGAGLCSEALAARPWRRSPRGSRVCFLAAAFEPRSLRPEARPLTSAARRLPTIDACALLCAEGVICGLQSGQARPRSSAASGPDPPERIKPAAAPPPNRSARPRSAPPRPRRLGESAPAGAAARARGGATAAPSEPRHAAGERTRRRAPAGARGGAAGQSAEGGGDRPLRQPGPGPAPGGVGRSQCVDIGVDPV